MVFIRSPIVSCGTESRTSCSSEGVKSMRVSFIRAIRPAHPDTQRRQQHEVGQPISQTNSRNKMFKCLIVSKRTGQAVWAEEHLVVDGHRGPAAQKRSKAFPAKNCLFEPFIY
jgi:hypothetical protein